MCLEGFCSVSWGCDSGLHVNYDQGGVIRFATNLGVRQNFYEAIGGRTMVLVFFWLESTHII